MHCQERERARSGFQREEIYYILAYNHMMEGAPTLSIFLGQSVYTYTNSLMAYKKKVTVLWILGAVNDNGGWQRTASILHVHSARRYFSMKYKSANISREFDKRFFIRRFQKMEYSTIRIALISFRGIERAAWHTNSKQNEGYHLYILCSTKIFSHILICTTIATSTSFS